jgi:hypothetical protein
MAPVFQANDIVSFNTVLHGCALSAAWPCALQLLQSRTGQCPGRWAEAGRWKHRKAWDLGMGQNLLLAYLGE